MKSEISFKLYYEELKVNTKRAYHGPGKASVVFEEVIFAAGRQLRVMMAWAYYFLRLQLKHGLWSTSIMIFMLYSRL